MEKHINNVKSLIKNNPIIFGAIGLAIILSVSVFGYVQSQNSALQRKQVEAETKLIAEINDSKKTNSERLAKVAEEEKMAEADAAKKAEEEKAKAEAEAAAQAAAAEKEKQYAATQSAQQSGSISLSAGDPIAYDGKQKIPVNWSAGFVSEKGWKLVWNNSGSPTYPGSEAQYIGDSQSSGSSYVQAYSPGNYYIRVCQYLGDGTCGSYSNEVMVTIK